MVEGHAWGIRFRRGIGWVRREDSKFQSQIIALYRSAAAQRVGHFSRHMGLEFLLFFLERKICQRRSNQRQHEDGRAENLHVESVNPCERSFPRSTVT